MAPAPWDGIPAQNTLFVLVTGGNSGIGFGIGERLIDEFLTTRSLSSHLVVIPTTRSTKKSQETIDGLRRHTKQFAATSQALRARGGPDYDPKQTTRRVHILSVQVDLCNLPSVRRAANQLVSGTVSSPSDDDHFVSLVDVKIPRLDSLIFNAGIGGWYGVDWIKLIHNIFTKGLVNAATWPTYKGALSGQVIDPIKGTKGTGAPQIGEVFCANVFGHYMLAQRLVPLLTRPASSTLPPGRIIWESSVEAALHSFSPDDFEATKTNAAYESTKRLTDVLALTSTLPASKPYVDRYLGVKAQQQPPAAATPPKIYLVHPGVVQTTIFPLNAFMFFWYAVVLYIARWLGSPWHPITAYNGACAPVWLALQEQGCLDGARAERVKWGSSADRRGECRVKKTEVDGWGWEGRVEEMLELKQEQKLAGRRPGAVDVTEEMLAQFEELGANCWRRMEALREEWEKRVDAVESGLS
ncbi:4c9865f5-7378-4a4e-9c8a-0dd8f17ee34a [Thermothielavioides terrestris]|uniref:3-keto steroid reductase-like protein n=2 Tax=Thermothielavioides terrestris TaxID=2587410 RepID=G2QQY6_THETT|nr:3-keto steroid reductase-like protein [Thermothielavioides terrestris NRRL 8126]AEO64144.1 3-keto steroid reductase-like protein [Thermothielavioides terrestris NRRL 8126]SPQ27001.1 4c9865f5-7378-4a4e-9c8a-0dd8f17ee34a [Thermothielavioides terrestris]